jgi:hypothetical protein
MINLSKLGLKQFMSYNAFLLVMSQLAGKKKARIVVQGNVIFFEASEKKNHLKLYTKVYSGDGYLPKSVRSCVSSSGVLRWQRGGAYIKLDHQTHSVFLIEEVEMEQGKYIPFKNLLSDFSLVAAEWKEILQEFAEKDYTQAT